MPGGVGVDAGEAIGADLAALVVATSSVDELLVGIAELAARAVPSAVSAGLALTASAWSGHAVAADGRVARLEAIQRRAAAGPGADALRLARPVGSGDLSGERRWPVFSRAAVGAGMRAVRAVPMLVRGGAPVGVLSVYGAAAGAFDGADGRRTDLVAGFATVAVTGAMRSYDETALSARLHHALVSRSAIDQAIGIVMAERTCSVERAVTILRAAARRRGTTLQDVVAGGEPASIGG